jgi:hypothetical protein
MNRCGSGTDHRTAERLIGKTQAELQLALYGRTISPGGPATYHQVAELMHRNPATVDRQCTGVIPVQAATILALALLDPEGGRQMLETLAQAMGYTLAPLGVVP